MTYKKGTRVVAIRDSDDGYITQGWTGIIVQRNDHYKDLYLIQFDEYKTHKRGGSTYKRAYINSKDFLPFVSICSDWKLMKLSPATRVTSDEQLWKELVG